MTAAYDLFVRELHATGREYTDGFSGGNLLQLTPDERLLVRQALHECLARREPRAPIALVLLDRTDQTRATLQALLPVQTGPSVQHDDFDLEVAAAIVVLADVPVALDMLERQIKQRDSLWRSGLAEQGLRRAHPRSDASARLARILRNGGGEQDLLIGAADALLQRHGWQLEDPNPARQADTVQLMRAMIGADAAQRDAALLKVLKTPVKPWPT